jgi:SPP1 gp7 family putative phage head morphogenesis protein
VPTTELPLLHGRNYAKLIREEVLAVMRRLIDEQLVPQIPFLLGQAATVDSLVTDLDPWASRLTAIISDVKIQMARQVTDAELAELVRRRVASGVMVANGELNRQQLKVLLGIDVLTGDDRLLGLTQDFVSENVALIKSIPAQYFDQVEDVVLSNVRAGRRSSVIEDEIARRFDVSATRAAFIARDQTNKFNGNITRQRHQDLGIVEYIWRTARDDRVRPDHSRLEGETFRYDSPPVVDLRTGRRENPGGDFNCRCTAEPVIPGLDVEPQDLRRRIAPETAVIPIRARRAARRQPAGPAPKPEVRESIGTRSGKRVRLTPRQAEADQNARWLRGDPDRWKDASPDELQDMFQWDWVHGSKRRNSVLLKTAAIREFGLKGVPFSLRKFSFSPTELKAARGVVRRMRSQTRKELGRRGVDKLRVYRGIKSDVPVSGSIESWSTSRRTAEKFGTHEVMVDVVPSSKVLNYHGSPDWVDGIFGDQAEVMILE